MKQPAIQGLGQLLGSRKDFRNEKGLVPASVKDDGVSMLSGKTPEDATSPDAGNSQDTASPMSIAIPNQNHELFSPPAGGKCRLLLHPKHNLRTMSSQFITRVTFLFFFWASHDKYNIHVINQLVHLIKYNTLISLETVSAQLGMS
jgi:hypothetical protein